MVDRAYLSGGHASGANDPASSNTTPSTLLHVPFQPTPFVGRQEELTAIATRLSNPECRLLTITGPGGIGKTRLAIQAVAEGVVGFANGIYCVSLAAVSAPEFIISAIADALNFSFYGQEDTRTQLLNYLRGKSLLLVVDNFEHLLDGVGLLTDILHTAPGVKLLVTSRERLNVAEEWVFQIGGLDFPDSETLEALEGYSAVQLFLQNARRVHADFSPANAEWPSIVRICRLVEGMPLGIELAAAWVRALSCREIAAEIESGLDILATSLRNAPAKHRSMRAVFEHSWKLLSEEEQHVFMRLSVFRGGFTREAAERVAGASLWTLSSLVDKSLLKVNPAGRYDIHELLRQYAEEQLGQRLEQRDAIQNSHGEHFAEFAFQRGKELRGSKQQAALTALEADIDNLRLAWRWASEQANLPALSKLSETWRFYDVRGWWKEGHDTFGSAIEKLGSEASVALGRLLVGQCFFSYRLGLLVEMRASSETAIDIFRRHDLELETLLPLCGLGSIAFSLGEFAAGYRFVETALSMARAHDDQWGTGRCLHVLGYFNFVQGDYGKAKELYLAASSISREIGDMSALASDLANLGDTSFHLGDYADAKRILAECIAVATAIRFQMFLADAFHGLGRIAQLEGDYGEAKHKFEESLAIFEQIGDPEGAPMVLKSLQALEFKRPPATRETAREHDTVRLFVGTQALIDPLTSRELEILQLIAEGLSSPEVAQRLYLGVSTIRWYLRQIYDKLHVHNRTQAIARARELNLLA